MEKKEQKIDAEIFSYEEYCVFDLLSSKGITIHGHTFSDDEMPDFDLFAPDGILPLDLSGKTLVEVKVNLSYSTIKQIDAYYETNGAEYNVLVVYFKSTVTNYPTLEINSQGKTLLFISYKDLKVKFKKKTDKKKDAYYADRAKKSEWKTARQDIIKNAQDVISQGNNVLFLGAGISISANMPSWKDLLKGLMGEVKQLKTSTLEAFKELSSHVLEECGDSNLIMGRYLQTAISLYNNKAVFSELIQKYLYNENNTSPLLMNLARIVQHKKVNEVITYNFDDLLEQNLVKLNLKDSVDFTAISKDAEIKGHNTLPIYHVHGIIPKEGPVDTVVFSEEEYHKRYSTAYHWSNVEQLHALTRTHCFFVGLSMTDPNLRRLLDTAKEMNNSNGINHYAFLQRKNLENYCVSDVNNTCKYVHVSGSLIDKDKQKEIYDLNYSVIDSIFMDLGVNVIWYEDHNELPRLVAEVFGVTQYEGMDKKELIALCEKKIGEIKDVEKEFLDNNAEKQNPVKFYKIMSHAREIASAYRECVSEAQDMLNVLTNSINWDEIGDEKIKEVQNKAPKFGDNMNGYGDFFTIWLETLKKFYE
jgi:hypothetical protein